MTEDWGASDQRRAVRDGYDQLASEYDARRTDAPEDADFLDELRERIPTPEESVSILEAEGFKGLWRRIVDDALGDETGFVLARKTG